MDYDKSEDAKLRLSGVIEYIAREGQLQVAEFLADSIGSVSPDGAASLLASVAEICAEKGLKEKALGISRKSDLLISSNSNHNDYQRSHVRILARIIDFHLARNDSETALKTVAELPFEKESISVLCRVGVSMARKS